MVLANPTNDFLGNVQINTGTISVASIGNVGVASHLGAGNASGTIEIANGTNPGRLIYTGSGNTTNRVVNLTGSTATATIEQAGTGLLKFTSNFTATGVGTKSLVLTGNGTGSGEISGDIVNNSGNLTNVTKQGTGTWILSRTTTMGYSGATTVSGGTLMLDLNAMTTPTNMVAATSAPTLNGGTLLVRGKSGAVASAQTLGNLTLSGVAASSLLVNPNGGTSTTVTLGTITNATAGSSLLVGRAAGSGTGTVALTTTTAKAATNVYNRLVYTDGTLYDWATTVTGASPFTLSGLAAGSYTALPTAVTTNTNNSLISAGTTLTGAVTTNTLKVENPAASQSLALGTNTLTLTGGGLLNTGTEPFTISGGTLTAGNGTGAYEVLLHQYSAGTLTIASAIANNGANATAFTKAGTGTARLTGANTFTGGINVTAGTLEITGTTSATGTTTVANGLLRLAGTTAAGATAYTVNGGTLQMGTATGIAAGTTLTLNDGTFDLNGFNTTISNLGTGGVTARITDTSAGTGITRLTLTSFTTSSSQQLVDGPSRQLAVSVANGNGTPMFANQANTFSGGLTLMNNGTGTRLGLSFLPSNVGVPGAIVSSPFGRGPITIGEAANQKAQIFTNTAVNQSILNDVVFNSALGTDVTGAFRVDSTNLTLAGTLTGNLAPVNLSTYSGGSATLLGRITGAGGLRVVRGSLNGTPVNNVFTLTLNNVSGTANDYTGPTTVDAVTVLALGAAEQIPDGFGDGDMALAGTLRLDGFNETLNGLNGAGVVDGGYGTPVLAVGGNDATSSFTGTIQNTIGSLGIAKIGTGSLTLGGTNTYVGGTTLAGGRLELGSAGALGTTGGITFSGGTLVSSGSNALDYSARFSQAAAQPYSVDTNGVDVTWATGLSGAGSTLTKAGQGRLVLAAANQFAGGISLAGGSLELGASGALGSAGTISFAGGALRYSSVDATDYSARFSNAAGQPYAVDTNGRDVTFASALTSVGGAFTKQGPGTLALTAANSYSGDTTIAGGTLAIGTGGTSGRIGSGSVDVGASGLLTFNRTDNYGGDFTNTVFGSGGIRVQQGTLTVAGSNSYSGSTTVVGGTLRATTSQAFGGSFAADALALAGGRVDLVSDFPATFGPFGLGIGTTVSANSTLASDRLTAGEGLAQELGTLAMGGQTLTIARGANVTSGTATVSFSGFATFSADPTIVTNSGAEVVFGGGLGGSLSTLTKGGAGLLTLTSAGHSGAYAINAGTFQIGTGSTSGSIAGATGVSVGSGALVAFNRTDDYGGPLTTPITGAGGISLAGGTLALDAANTFAGPTTVAGGTLRVGTAGTSGTLSGTSGVSLASGSSLVFDRTDNYGGSFAAPITGAGGLSLNGGTLALSGAASFAGPTAVDGGTLRIGAGGTTGSLTGTSGVSLAFGTSLAFNRSDNYGGAFSAPITGAGSVSLAAGTLSLSGSNAFTGGVSIDGGRLVATTANALGQGNVTIAANAFLRLLNTPALGAGNTIAMTPGGGLEYASGVSADLLGSSSLAGWSILASNSRASTASLLFGTVPAAGTTLSAAWTPDSDFYSDILSLSGTGADNPFVLSMTYDPTIAPALLTELNIARRLGTAGEFSPIGTAFQGVGTPWTSVFVTPGQYGVDTTTQTVWVVGDANSQFIVVPEPGTLALVAVAAAAAGLAATRRRRR